MAARREMTRKNETAVLAHKYRLAQAVALIRYYKAGDELEVDDRGKVVPTAEDHRQAEQEYQRSRTTSRGRRPTTGRSLPTP